jgi:hypothetical protein
MGKLMELVKPFAQLSEVGNHIEIAPSSVGCLLEHLFYPAALAPES